MLFVHDLFLAVNLDAKESGRICGRRIDQIGGINLGATSEDCLALLLMLSAKANRKAEGVGHQFCHLQDARGRIVILEKVEVGA